MSSFTDPLIVSPLPDGRNWVLVEEFDYDVGAEGSGDTVHVPAGFVTDFASVPQFLWSILPYWGKYGKAAVVHDYLYSTHQKTKQETDRVFLEAMLVEGTPKSKAEIMYWAVRLFGFWAWRNDIRHPKQ